MADKVRPIDANALRLMKVAECAGHTIEYALGWKACVEYCKNDAPTIEAKPVDDWISVKDRLPPYGERVLVINEAYGAEHRYTKYNIGVTVRSPHLDFTFWGHKVTHWQPLPKPPKGGRL